MESRNANEGGMEGSSSSSSSSVCEEGGAGWLTSTPQPLRRPLHQLNTASPRPQLTPYKYHGCRAIPEEREDQENIDPSNRAPADVCLSAKCSGISSDSTTNLGSDSSPFAYPLIWESSHASASPSSGSPHDRRRPNTTTPDINNWRSPVSHLEQKSLSSTPSDSKGGRGGGSTSKEGSGKVRNRSGSSEVSSSSKIACHHGPSVTPSKPTLTQTVTNTSIFLTPSSSMHSSRQVENRNGQTPKQQHHQQSIALSTTQSINPFEVGAESLYLSAVSPSLFQHVVSPSQKVGGTFRWSIDQMAELYPVNIETSPFTQVEVIGDPEYERRAQDAIDRFFTTHQSVIPSPWTSSNKSVSLVKKMCVQQAQASPCLAPTRSQSVWCQTELSLPPVLPPALEEALKPFCTFTQSQWWQGGTEGEDAANLNNTTLRRKLLFSHEDVTASTPPMGSPQEKSKPSTSSASQWDGRTTSQSAGGQKAEEEEEGRLAWCTDVVGSKEGASVMRRLPPTPPLVCDVMTPSTTTTTRRAVRRGTSPLIFSTDDVSTPVSPDVSPIHLLDYSSDTEAKHPSPSTESSSGSYCEHQRTLYTFISPGDPPQSTLQPPSQSPVSVPRHSPSPIQAQGEKKKVEKGEEEEEEDMQSDQKKAETAMNITESFCVQYSVKFSGKEQKSDSPVASSPTTDHRSSSNSGHFSSSPIRDVTHSPLEVDSPSRRFSTSPPLSPILYRTTHMPSTRQTSIMLRKERKTTVEVTMMEESEMGAPPALGVFQRSSSLYDVEMDSQPSLESNFEETASQDTGYQTISSLLTSNFSCNNLPHDLPSGPLLESASSTKHQAPSSSTRSKEFRS